ncbi:hypothetical protein ES288_D03G119300v1 [Gossypium darwinii]|uniref:Pectate lyase n=1 Tax=Gossypium darwinii TaxID=34276 RepID=A0A5D2D697_GOSDA|nr:hypothetical protein ES288_D03G119300v1 [Gossypium darwinii]
MTMKVVKIVLFLGLIVYSPIVKGNIGHFDEVWQERAENAKKGAFKAYNPNPENVTSDFNRETEKVLEGQNNTRRGLYKHHGPCLATNPIDRCWRCDPNWAKDRKKLVNCVLGFGRKTTGGKAGRYYVVTDPSDNDMVNPKPGTLRHAVIQKEPLWIIFAHHMVIRLNQELIMAGDKTIDGRGFQIHIVGGAQITLQFINNVIIHGLHIRNSVQAHGGLIRDSVDHYGQRTMSDGDGITIFGSHNIWIDHLSMSKCYDGLIDILMASTAITISNCHFTNHNDVFLFGSSDSFSDDQIMQVTVAFNHFGKGLVQRMPRVRWGFVHVVNNDYTHWLMYAIGGSKNPTILSEGNRFIAPPDKRAKEITKREYSPESVWKSWKWRSVNDLMMNGAFFVESGGPISRGNEKDVINAKTGASAGRLTRFAGALNCVEHKPC